MPKVYVVTAPDRIGGIYSSWPECEAAVKGVSGARHQRHGTKVQWHERPIAPTLLRATPACVA
jgi:viroplasmin and RNaseH domain-containing protein